jgi:hypothetical protein
MRIALIIGIIGILILSWSSTFKPYKDSSEISKAMQNYPQGNMNSQAASEKYLATRYSQLTPKYSLEDYGLTLIILALIVLFTTWIYSVRSFSDLRNICTPNSIWIIVIIGIAASILTPLSSGASLILGSWRDEYPPWADSLGIPLMGTPIMVVVFLLFVALFSFLSNLDFTGGQNILFVFRKKMLPKSWYWAMFGIPMFFSLMATIVSIANGDFLLLIPSFIWFIYFLFLFVEEQSPTGFYL